MNFLISGPLSYLTIENPNAQNGRELVVFGIPLPQQYRPVISKRISKGQFIGYSLFTKQYARKLC